MRVLAARAAKPNSFKCSLKCSLRCWLGRWVGSWLEVEVLIAVILPDYKTG